jgi:hypothetical protein
MPTPRLFLEFDDNITMAQAEEFFGRLYARSRCLTVNRPNQYPMAPETWIGPPTDPPISQYLIFYTRAKLKPTVGGVLELDDVMVGLADNAEETLSDESVYSIDVPTVAKTWEQLSEPARVVLTPVEFIDP